MLKQNYVVHPIEILITDLTLDQRYIFPNSFHNKINIYRITSLSPYYLFRERERDRQTLLEGKTLAKAK